MIHRRLACLLCCVLSYDFATNAALAADAAIHPDEGLPQVSWDQADQVFNRTAFVFGKVLDVRTAGKITFVNFDSARPAKFAGVIFADNMKNFPTPPKELYAGKIVRIRGTVTVFKGRAEMSIKSPEQVEVLAALPETLLPKAIQRLPRKTDQVTVAAYNVLNMFDDVDDPYRHDEDTPAKPREQMAALARSIVELDADVIAMEEVENRDYLKRFLEVFLPDAGYDHVVCIEGNDSRGIDVALVSRIPVGQVRSHQYLRFPAVNGGTQGFMRDVLSVTLEPPGGQPFEAWVVHLKSNSGGREAAEPIRLAEARELRKLLDARLTADPQARFAVMGDFNDTWGTPTMTTIIGEGPAALWSAGSDFADKSAVSYNEGDFRSVIDFMLCSPAMAKAYVKGSYRMPQGSISETGSDHNPIEATFQAK